MLELIERIKTELEKRRKRNRFYSLRAMARDLGVSSSCLSRTLNGKTRLSRKNELRIRAALEIP
ncbi:hypothetical protein D3C87_1533390 [compost metagenome]